MVDHLKSSSPRGKGTVNSDSTVTKAYPFIVPILDLFRDPWQRVWKCTSVDRAENSQDPPNFLAWLLEPPQRPAAESQHTLTLRPEYLWLGERLFPHSPQALELRWTTLQDHALPRLQAPLCLRRWVWGSYLRFYTKVYWFKTNQCYFWRSPIL